jgi:hypothetical protein
VQVPGETQKVFVPVDVPRTVEAKTEPEVKLPAKALPQPDVRKKDAAVTTPKKGDWCYADENENGFLARTRGKQTFVRDEAGECWTCREMPPGPQVNFKNCAHYRTCSKAQDPTKCAR